MKKLLSVVGAMLIGVMAVSAAPVDCSSGSVTGALTLNRLLAGGDLAGGCTDQDKTYTNFTYSGETAASQVQFDFSFLVVGGQDIHSANFQGPWTENFTLSYTLNVTDPLRWISGVQLDMTRTGTAGNPSVSQSNVPAGMTNPLVANVGGDASTMMPYNTQQIQVTINGSANGGAIGQFTSTYTQSEIPEPSTYALLGAGLAALGFIRRKVQ